MPLELTDESLIYHLQNNLYPPIDLRVILFVKQAITLCCEGNGDQEITLRHGERTLTKTAEEMVADLRLEEFTG